MITKQKIFKFIFIFAITPIILTACSSKKQQDNRVVIWTSCSEFAQYIELFNKTHTDSRAVLVYKENPALSLPPAKDELPPDLIIGSWLRTDTPQRNFKSLDYLFDTKSLTSDIFYSQLLESGKHRKIQYLLPVSFNLPSIIFSTENKDLITDSYTLTPGQIREIASGYNKKDKKGNYTRIGFTPLSNSDFLYLTSKITGTNFREEKNKILWNDEAILKNLLFLKDWIQTENTSAQIEEDFAFKYLFMSTYRQVTSGRTLFAYTTSDDLFENTKSGVNGIDYRWITNNGQLPIEDSYMMMGIYRKTRNQVGATEFINWFFQTENQRNILERKEYLNLDTEKFGIAGGFSSLRDVTEHILPVFYTHLLTNLPPAQMLAVPNQLPARWESYKSLVVEPYLKGYLTSIEDEEIQTLNYLEEEWRKKVFD